jgi:hypothetical protein
MKIQDASLTINSANQGSSEVLDPGQIILDEKKQFELNK